jgi:hypothetical protein
VEYLGDLHSGLGYVWTSAECLVDIVKQTFILMGSV